MTATGRSGNDPRLVEALRARGITDMDLVIVDVWNYGHHLIPEAYRGKRLGWVDLWYRGSAEANPYANPVNGLHGVVDLNSMELLELEDTFVVDAPATMGEYVPRLVPGQELRDDLRPLEIVQPEGVSFTLEGNLLRWQNWSLRVGFNYREGLVLHTVGYEDDGRVRPVAHRLSLAEMVVPYRDPSTDHYRRTAFDVGEWGLGFMTVPLELGCDCLGEITYVDAVTARLAGRAARRSGTRSASTRRTTLSSGSTSTRSRARRCGGCGASSSRSTPSLRTTTTSSTGASTRTGTSSARCGRPGSW